MSGGVTNSFVVVQTADVADEGNGAFAEIARTLRDVCVLAKIWVFIEQRAVVTKLTTAHMPVKSPSLQMEGEHVRKHSPRAAEISAIAGPVRPVVVPRAILSARSS